MPPGTRPATVPAVASVNVTVVKRNVLDEKMCPSNPPLMLDTFVLFLLMAPGNKHDEETNNAVR